MTPTLKGRWQTRFIITFVVGIPLGFLYMDIFPMCFMYLCGLGWDYATDSLQKRRWDGDWPTFFIAFQIIWEGVFFWFTAKYILSISVQKFWAMYSIFGVMSFILQVGVLQTFFPKRRFQGGKV